MKILLVYPKIPVTYWGFQHALKFVSKKAAFPPLGLLTIAAMIPDRHEKKLVDLNVEKLTDRDLRWADYVFISAMLIQKASVREILGRCRHLGVKTVAGGPLFTAEPEAYGDVDHLVLNEGEITMPPFLSDLERGEAHPVYTTDKWADITKTPVPLWSLLKASKYSSFNIQYSRGCPFQCDFCDITTLFGRVPRTKDAVQLVRELDAIYDTGWRGELFFVDDNFISNRNKLMEDILPAIIEWSERRGNPFCFLTEVSVNIADDDALMEMMVNAGFNSVFVGIETPDDICLNECSKVQNRNRDLTSCVKKIQEYGMEVMGGFIVGFDSDSETIFSRMIKFIQESGVVTAMVGLLNAPIGSRLYERLHKEGRIENNFTGNNTDYSMNFIPKMDRNVLEKGYQSIVKTIYSPKHYYERIVNFLSRYNPKAISEGFNLSGIRAFLRSVFRIGIFGKERKYYWKLLRWSLRNNPATFPVAVRLSIYGYHFRKLYEA
ncbi:MAG: B12-binding domain-containing radical SAM protein [Clostridiales bacterium]|nr:B12-binding domain-containing radical SAM protein [Clostridiales bacterium]